MLRQIRVRNFALIEDGFLEFGDGLNVITGETGAGKSILMAALGFVLGNRLESEWLRSGTKLSVEAVFEIPAGSLLEDALHEHAFEVDEGLLHLKREADDKSKSRSYCNGVLITASQIKGIAPFLVDIFQQGTSESLYDEAAQMNLVDKFSHLEKEVEEFSALFARYQSLQESKKNLLADMSGRERELDLLQYQAKEIEAAQIDLKEDQGLEELKIRLASSEKIGGIYSECRDKLHEGDLSALSLMGQVNNLLTSLKNIDPSTEASELTGEGEEIEVRLGELFRQLESYGNTLEHDPQRLEEIQTRLEVLDMLQRKYGGSLEEVIKFLETAKTRLEYLENSDENIKKFDEEIEALTRVLTTKGQELSKKRKKGALTIKKEVSKELQTFEMRGSQFEIAFLTSNFHSKGAERIEFQLSANEGEALKSLSKVASGGEASRIQLVFKKVFSETDPVGTLIFDEIDSGIGGRLGPVIGEKLHEIAEDHEVISITHLAPVASQADHHWQAGKETVEGKTKVVFEKLTGEKRVNEIAKMLSGKELTKTSLKHAKEILKPGVRPEPNASGRLSGT